MLGRLLASASEAFSKNRRKSEPLPPPDISRVLKIQRPEASPEVAFADPESLAVDAERAVEGLTDQFEAWMRRDLDALREAWTIAQAPDATAEDYRRIYTCAHNITGAAPSYGFPAVSRLAKSLCLLLSNTKPGENAPLINLHVEACRAAIAAGPQGDASHSVADAVCDALERRVAARLAG